MKSFSGFLYLVKRTADCVFEAPLEAVLEKADFQEYIGKPVTGY
jgi:hypothetical protein